MAMGADYSFELISIETYAPQFIGYNKLFLGSVGCLPFPVMELESQLSFYYFPDSFDFYNDL